MAFFNHKIIKLSCVNLNSNIKPGIKVTCASNKLSIYLQIKKKLYKICILNSLKKKEGTYC